MTQMICEPYSYWSQLRNTEKGDHTEKLKIAHRIRYVSGQEELYALTDLTPNSMLLYQNICLSMEQ